MHSETQNSTDESIQKLGQLIKGIKITMMTTNDGEGTLRSRPMATLEQEFNGDLWFFTRRSSGKAHSIMIDQQVNLAYAEPSEQKYVSVTGRADIIDDRAKEEELWNPAFKAWFPEGLEDPDLVLIRVKVDSAEFWDSKSSAMVHLIGFVKAVVTGQPYKAGKDEHDKVNIKH